MSGRRRRDDEWDDGRPDAQDARRDPWADDSIGEWASQDADPVEEADLSRKSSGGAAGAYVRNAPPGGKAYAAPDFPSFQVGGGSSGGDRYGSTSGHATQRVSAGYASGGYNADGYRDRDAAYASGRDGYQGAGYGRNGSGGNGAGRRDAAGYDASYGSGSGYGSANGRSASPGYTPEFTPVNNEEPEDDGSAGTPRPYGRLSIYTLHEDKTREFDRLAERAAEGVRTSEPDTLVYVIHVVPKAPQQRIIYEIYRDRAAFMSHERQPHIRQFSADRASCVLATNIIDLRLKYAKVAALGSPSEAPTPSSAPSQSQSQPSWSPRSAAPGQNGDRYAAAQYSATQYSPVPQYSSAQPQEYSSAQPQGATAAVASFTPAADRYGTDNSQYPTVGREAYSPSQASQYGNSGNGTYGTSGGQYGAANSNGYSGTSGYANGGSYPSSGYQSPNGYQSSNGYSGDNGYSGANGYQSNNGYSGSNGYSNGNGYQAPSGYANGANGYSSGYQNGAANGSGYGTPAGYTESGSGSYSASASAQYAPRFRELTSGTPSDPGTGGYQGSGGRYQEDGRQTEWDPRSQGYR
jgi:quinol monooxygenase YgiN